MIRTEGTERTEKEFCISLLTPLLRANHSFSQNCNYRFCSILSQRKLCLLYFSAVKERCVSTLLHFVHHYVWFCPKNAALSCGKRLLFLAKNELNNPDFASGSGRRQCPA